jgi:hypothetical protein
MSGGTKYSVEYENHSYRFADLHVNHYKFADLRFAELICGMGVQIYVKGIRVHCTKRTNEKYGQSRK